MYVHIYMYIYYTYVRRYGPLTILKGLRKKLYFVVLSRRATSFYAIFHLGSLFTLFTCFLRVNEEIIPRYTVQEEDQFLYFTQVHCSHVLHGIILQEVKGLIILWFTVLEEGQFLCTISG